MTHLQSGLIKLAVPSVVILLVLWRTRKVPREEIGFAKPPGLESFFWLALYLSWMLASDAWLHWRGPWDFAPWIKAGFASGALRVLAVCFLGPVAEELLFRGLLYAFLVKRIGAAATILITAAGWAALHYAYEPQVIGVIFVDGVLLGITRWRTKSIYPNFLQHIAYNLYAIW